MKTIIRTALMTGMVIPIAIGACAAVVVIGATAGYNGVADYVADLFDLWA